MVGSFCGVCGTPAARPPAPQCLTCGAPMQVQPGPADSHRATKLPLLEARDAVVAALAASGVQITAVTESTVSGTVAVQRNANVVLVILLMFLCLIPGIVYLVVARRTESYPFTVRLAAADGGGATLVACFGTGPGLVAARRAAYTLPTES